MIHQSGHVVGRGLVWGDSTHERFMQGELPAGNPRGRVETLDATVIAALVFPPQLL